MINLAAVAENQPSWRMLTQLYGLLSTMHVLICGRMVEMCVLPADMGVGAISNIQSNDAGG
jgi:hypothetical protein